MSWPVKRPEWKLECREEGSTFLCPLFVLWVAFGDYDPVRDLRHVWGFTIGWRRIPNWKPYDLMFRQWYSKIFSIGSWDGAGHIRG